MVNGAPSLLPENSIEVFIQVEGEEPRSDVVEVSTESSLQFLRAMIEEQLDDFDFDFKFLKQSGYDPGYEYVLLTLVDQGLQSSTLNKRASRR